MTSISTLSQQIGLVNRMKSIQVEMAKYQTQITTGVKHQTFKDYGTSAMSILRYRNDLINLDGFKKNIDIAQTQIKQMDTALNEVIAQVGNVLYAIDIELAKGEGYDVEGIKAISKTALQLIEANMNVKIGDRYLLAGTDVSNAPYKSSAMLQATMQTQMNNWMDGTSSTQDLLNNIKGLNTSQLGYNNTLQDAGRVTARVDESFEVDYTVRADGQGFKDIVASLNALAALQKPEQGVDVPSNDAFHDVINTLYRSLQGAVELVRKDVVKIASAAETMNSIQINHTNDQQNLRKIMENTEASNDTEAGTMFLKLQSQLEASYRVTSMMSQLSLTNYISF